MCQLTLLSLLYLCISDKIARPNYCKRSTLQDFNHQLCMLYFDLVFAHMFMSLIFLLFFVPNYVGIDPDFDARLRRLETLAIERAEIVEDYLEILEGEFTILNSINRHLVRSIRSFPLLPPSDSECYYNYTSERCEPHCLCSWQPRIGDLHPGRACRLVAREKKVIGQCDPYALPARGPLGKTIDFFKFIFSSFTLSRVPPRMILAPNSISKNNNPYSLQKSTETRTSNSQRSNDDVKT